MAAYLVSYDLYSPQRDSDYAPIIRRIRDDLGGQPFLYSVWIVRTQTANAVELRDDLIGYIDGADGLLVVGLTGEAAWNSVKVPNRTIKGLLAA